MYYLPLGWPDWLALLLVVVMATPIPVGAVVFVFAARIDALARDHGPVWWNRLVAGALRLAAACAVALGALGFYLMFRPRPGAPPCCSEQLRAATPRATPPLPSATAGPAGPP